MQNNDACLFLEYTYYHCTTNNRVYIKEFFMTIILCVEDKYTSLEKDVPWGCISNLQFLNKNIMFQIMYKWILKKKGNIEQKGKSWAGRCLASS